MCLQKFHQLSRELPEPTATYDYIGIFVIRSGGRLLVAVDCNSVTRESGANEVCECRLAEGNDLFVENPPL